MDDDRPDLSRTRLLIIGVGNEFRQDDGAGIAVARRLKSLGMPSVRIAELGGEGTELLDLFHEAESVIIVDATSSGAEPGTVHCFDLYITALPHGLARSSSHSFGVAEAIELARTLGQLPEACLVYGIEGKAFDYGNELSPEVTSAVERISRELMDWFSGRKSPHSTR
jgi:hydrogenase maturation protease